MRDEQAKEAIRVRLLLLFTVKLAVVTYHSCHSVLDRVKALSPSDPTQELSVIEALRGGTLCKDVYECSEYERAAHALAAVSRALKQLPPHATVPGHSSLLRQLGQKSDQLTEQLSARVRSRLCAIFSDTTPPG